MAAQNILVTGASAGIGAALARQLLADHGCRVFLGCRSVARGQEAVAAMALPSDAAARAHVLELDVTSDASVAAAAAAVRAALGDSNRLDAIVNNAGVGLATLVDAASTAAMLDTNLRGPMRVSSAFLPLLKAAGGRVVNVGSGSGPTYVKALIEGGGQAAAKALMEPADTEAVLAHATAHLGSAASDKAYKGYGLSKACLTAWSQVFAREHPALICVTCSPGFINTKLTAGFGVSAARAPAGVLRPSSSALFLTLSSTAFASPRCRRPARRPRRARWPSSTACLRRGLRPAGGTLAATPCARRCTSCATPGSPPLTGRSPSRAAQVHKSSARNACLPALAYVKGVECH
jgi:NAD(P)-dependent dehydrogenase (short-subunit alcohol dehydrogenase family)